MTLDSKSATLAAGVIKLNEGAAKLDEAYQEINAYFDVINEAIKSYPVGGSSRLV